MRIDIREIIDIARKAGEKVMQFYGGKVEFHLKSAGSPVTQADLESDEFIKIKLAKYDIPILTEESHVSVERSNSQYLWIVDPLDGTKDFIGKTDEFSILIGLVKDNEPYLGVVYEPATGNVYFAEKEKGAFCEKNGITEMIHVSDRKDFSEMRIFHSRSHLLEKELLLAEKLKIENKLTMGSAGLKIIKIAEGMGEIYINSSDKTSEWDTCAPSLILEEAGGIITSGKGEKLKYNKKDPRHVDGFIATNGTAHRNILTAYNEISVRNKLNEEKTGKLQ
jgi:3'(2'), 5'-bisphosphate nucleotidase